MQRVIAAATVAAFLLPPATLAVEAHHQPTAGQAAKVADAMVDGEVRKVDRDAKKITLRHGPIPNLDMPPMTMVFQVTDAAMLDEVKTGDKVKFSADKVGGAYTVTRIEPAK